MKTCTKCQISKSETDFNKKTGRQLQPYCRSCQKAYRDAYYSDPERRKKHIATVQVTKEVRTRRAQEFVNALKNAPCTDCGKTYKPWQMQYDHLRDKENNISYMAANGLPNKIIQAEIEKCELVCVLCHADRTYRRAHPEAI